MGGGSDKIKPTEAELAEAEVYQQDWDNSQRYGIPLEVEAIRRNTGYVMNAESGEYEIDPNGILNPDGTAKTDTTDARTANESAFTAPAGSVNPNRLSAIEEVGRDGAKSGANTGTAMGIGQQQAATQGLVNEALRGKGQQTEAVTQQSQLNMQTQQDSIADAQASINQRNANSQLLGQVVGTGIGIAGAAGKFDKFDPTVTPRIPGDHHPS